MPIARPRRCSETVTAARSPPTRRTITPAGTPCGRMRARNAGSRGGGGRWRLIVPAPPSAGQADRGRVSAVFISGSVSAKLTMPASDPSPVTTRPASPASRDGLLLPTVATNSPVEDLPLQSGARACHTYVWTVFAKRVPSYTNATAACGDNRRKVKLSSM